MPDRTGSESKLISERLVLEPLEVEHARLLIEGLSDERLYRFIPQDAPQSLNRLEDRYRKLSGRASPDGTEIWSNFAMRLQESSGRDWGTYVGTLEATVLPDARAYIAYLVFPSFWRRGYATEGCRRLIEHLDTSYGVSTVLAEIDTRNISSVALVETLGLSRVSTTFGADHFKGSSSDEYLYELKIER